MASPLFVLRLSARIGPVCGAGIPRPSSVPALQKNLHDTLIDELKRQEDPPVLGKGDGFDNYIIGREKAPRKKRSGGKSPWDSPAPPSFPCSFRVSRHATRATNPAVVRSWCRPINRFI